MKKSRGFAQVIMLSVLLILAVIGYFVYKNKHLVNSTSPINLTQVFAPRPSISDWKTYSTNNYSIKYPPDWKINDKIAVEGGYKTELSNKKIRTYKNDESITITIGIGGTGGPKLDYKKQKIGNYEWDVYNDTNSQSGSLNSDGTVTHWDGRYYRIVNPKGKIFELIAEIPVGYPSTYTLLDQIVSTFKFTN